MIDERATVWGLVFNFEGHLMKHDQGGGADQAKAGKAREQARAGAPSGAIHQEAKGVARPADEGRLQKAAGDVREILRNSRHQ